MEKNNRIIQLDISNLTTESVVLVGINEKDYEGIEIWRQKGPSSNRRNVTGEDECVFNP